MPRRPRFKAHYHVRIVSEDETVLLWEAGYRVLRSRLIALLAPYIDGRRSVEDILSLLAPQLTPLDVTFGLRQLIDGGYIEDAEHNENEGERAFLGLLGAAALPPRSAVQLKSAGNAEISTLESALHRLNIDVTDDAQLTLIVTDDYLRPELSNMQAPWLLIKPVGVVGSIGPLFLPESGPCWHCLAARLRENPEMRVLQEFPHGSDDRPYSVAALPSTTEAILHLAATEAYKYLATGAAHHLDGMLITLDASTLETKRHMLPRREGCPHCPPPQTEPPATFHRYERHISPFTGVVAALGPLNVATANSIHVYAAVHNFTLQYGRKSSPARWLGSRSIGKGMTASQARRSALCEALERYSGCWRGYEASRFCSAQELGDSAVPIENCLLFSESQYAHRDEWNRREGDYNFVPQRFDPFRRVAWVELRSLTHGRPRYLPAAFCYYNVPIDEEDHDFCRPDSNGNAAGDSLQEAILAGIFEVVERDAAAIWWYNRARRPGVEIESFPLPYFGDLLADYARLGRRLWALDLTTDFGIPVFVAISQSLVGNDDPVAGFGAHFDAQIALTRACTEVNQAVAAIESGATVRIALGQWASRDFLHPDPAQRFVGYSNPSTGNIDRNLRLCIDRARELGIEILVLDQTRADVGLPVAKVVMPGMRHFWARFAPGRLYKVPSPKQEPDLNPAHLIL
ncbi:MAG TPA: TOMM precursor leader peptide-binding protein [Bryobacteraceae bacterium]|jgi:ribosomal protein S12 methylthiotransferase accessory factor|nr:TOMM precursor leader peptide-binding protein [Bryobacteraceae bacterium]